MTERELFQLLEHAPDACAVLAEDLTPLALNAKAIALFRLSSRAGSASTTAMDLFSETSQSSLLHWFADGDAPELSLLVRTGDGAAQNWCRTTKAEVHLGERRAFLIALRPARGPELTGEDDVHEYRRLREAASARRVGIFEHDHTSNEIYGNGEVRAQYGLDPTAPLSIATFAGATHPDDAEYLVGQIAKAHDPSGDGVFDVRHRILPKTGGVRWIHTCAQTRFRTTEQGHQAPFLTTGSVIDITEHHLREDDHRRLAAILEATIDLVAMTDLDGRVTYLNRAGRAWMGVPPDEPLPALLATELFAEPQREKLSGEAIPTALGRGSFQWESALIGQQNRAIPVSVVLLAHGETRSTGAYFSIIARDLSQQKDLEARLLHAQKLEAVGRLAGGIAHDFNNLLSVIVGFTDLALRAEPGNPGTSAELEEVLRAAQRAGNLTQQLLSFSRKQVLSPVVLDVNEVLRELMPMLRRLVPEHIALTLRLGEPSAHIKVDKTQFEQVIINLLVNARDALPEGGTINLETCTSRHPATLEPSTNGSVSLSVSDNGEGIDPAIRDQIFDPFFTTKPPGQGTGLGLATVFGIVSQSGGDIAVFTEPGRGTTFRVNFPTSSEPRTLPPEETVSTAPVLRGSPILIVEDDPQLRNMLIAVLSRAGYDTRAAATPVEALTLAREHPEQVALLLTDVVMPQMTGLQLGVRLREAGLRFPVLYISGYAEDALSGKEHLVHGLNFLPKPIDPQRLVVTIDRLLRSAAQKSA